MDRVHVVQDRNRKTRLAPLLPKERLQLPERVLEIMTPMEFRGMMTRIQTQCNQIIPHLVQKKRARILTRRIIIQFFRVMPNQRIPNPRIVKKINEFLVNIDTGSLGEFLLFPEDILNELEHLLIRRYLLSHIRLS